MKISFKQIFDIKVLIIVILSFLLGINFKLDKKLISNYDEISIFGENTKKMLFLSSSLIKKYEGFSGVVYRCPAGQKTIGFGSVNFVKKYGGASSLRLYKEDYNNILIEDILKISFDVKYKYFKEYKLNYNEVSSLNSLIDNIGEGNFLSYNLYKKLKIYFKSKKLGKIDKNIINSIKREWKEICFYYDKNGNVIKSKHLQNRRMEEINLFFKKV